MHKLSKFKAFRIRNQSCTVKVPCRSSLASCLLRDSTKCLSPAKVARALLRSMGLLQMLLSVVSLTWSNTIVSRGLYSSAGRPATHANVVANRSVAVELVRPTTWKGRLSLSRVIFGVAANTRSITLRKSVSSNVFSFMQYRRRDRRRGPISGTLTIMPLKTSVKRVISSARQRGSV